MPAERICSGIDVIQIGKRGAGVLGIKSLPQLFLQRLVPGIDILARSKDFLQANHHGVVGNLAKTLNDCRSHRLGLEDLPDKIKDETRFIFAERIEEVLKLALLEPDETQKSIEEILRREIGKLVRSKSRRVKKSKSKTQRITFKNKRKNKN